MAKPESTGASGRVTKAMTIETFKELTVWEKENQQIRAKVCSINGYTRVGVSKFYRISDAKPWIAAPKGGHLYLNPEQWRKLAQHTHALTQVLAKTEKKLAAASSGMCTL